MIPEYTKRAIDKYNKKVKSINIPFNMEKETDACLYEYLKNCPNKTALIKDLVADYLKNSK